MAPIIDDPNLSPETGLIKRRIANRLPQNLYLDTTELVAEIESVVSGLNANARFFLYEPASLRDLLYSFISSFFYRENNGHNTCLNDLKSFFVESLGVPPNTADYVLQDIGGRIWYLLVSTLGNLIVDETTGIVLTPEEITMQYEIVRNDFTLVTFRKRANYVM